MSDGREEFYVGYIGATSTALSRWLKRFTVGAVLAAAFLGGLWIAAQNPFDAGTFEFGEPRSFVGIVLERPYPSLLVERPGSSASLPGFSRYWLVGSGKRGADDAVQGLDGKAVELRGELVYRDEQTMIKLGEAPVTELPRDGADHFEVPALERIPRSLGPAEISGEIVDPQCFLGIMKPGFGPTHRGCTIRCLAGGVPPVLRALDPSGQPRYYLLLGKSGTRINRELLPFAAVHLNIHGQLFAYGDLLAMEVDTRTLPDPDRPH